MSHYIKKYFLLLTALALVALLALLNLIALSLYLYWTVWWYDVMMHLLAGLAGGLTVCWFVRFYSPSKQLFFVLISVMIVGITWEVFEYIFDIAAITNYVQDTTLDLIADAAGAVLATIYASGQTPRLP
jgi:hypothetical protein